MPRRVSSPSAPSGWAANASSGVAPVLHALSRPGADLRGLPRFVEPSAMPAMPHRGNLESSILRRLRFCGSAGCPVSTRLRCACNAAPGLPRALASPALPAMRFFGSPRIRILRRCRLAVLRFAPDAGLSVSPTIHAAGCPTPRILRLRLAVSPGRAPGFVPSGCTSGESPDRSASSSPLARRPAKSSSRPESRAARRCRLTWSSGCPKSLALRRCR